jgi:DNA-directed RNA polymerase subunit K/omega
MGALEFAVLAGLRAAQLARGCVPRISGAHKVAVMAQMEVSAKEICRSPEASPQAAD